MDLCRAGGVPGVGIHQHIFGIAIVDVLGTIAGALILGRWLGYYPVVVFIVLMLIGTFMHMGCEINTTLTNLLGYVYPDTPANPSVVY
jgi:hypothetical protein